ncbi:hypothetical protein [Rhodoplanes roseus]|uniref:hypothetical protein n=1 Tax=Rhodoplanes roseus TaxID=29409 RepID=UPI001FDFED02|nr:hypothetical protein [Rhodoplanes roseus]
MAIVAAFSGSSDVNAMEVTKLCPTRFTVSICRKLATAARFLIVSEGVVIDVPPAAARRRDTQPGPLPMNSGSCHRPSLSTTTPAIFSERIVSTWFSTIAGSISASCATSVGEGGVRLVSGINAAVAV